MKLFKLKERLFNFWNSDKDYYAIGRSLNLDYYDGKHPFHLEIINSIKQNFIVLDLACGTAEMGNVIGKRANYVGIDISEIGIRMAREYMKETSKITLMKCDVNMLPFKDNSFDVIFSTYSFEHFLNPSKVLRESKRVLKEGGRLFILSPAYDNPFFNPPSISFSSIAHLSFGKKIASRKFRELICHFINRVKYLVRQTIKQAKLFLNKDYFVFEIIKNPRVLKNDYSPDMDVVYVVSIRETLHYLKSIDM